MDSERWGNRRQPGPVSLFLPSMLRVKVQGRLAELLLYPPLKTRDPGRLCTGPQRKDKGTDRMGRGCAYKSECRLPVGNEDLVKERRKKKIKPNPEDPVQCPDGDRDGCRPKGPSSLLVQVLPGGGAQGPISQRREPGEALAEGRRVTGTPKADRSTGLDTSLRGAERSFCGPE